MLKLKPNLPGCKIIGELYSDDPNIMGEDMCDVVLPNNILISAGWYPECDPKGRYYIDVTDGFALLDEFNTLDINEAKTQIEKFAHKYL